MMKDDQNKQIYLTYIPLPKITTDLTINSAELPKYEFEDKKCFTIGSQVDSGKTINVTQFLSQKYLAETEQFGFIFI